MEAASGSFGSSSSSTSSSERSGPLPLGGPKTNADYVSKLFHRREIDEPDELDVSWSQAYATLMQTMGNATEKEINNILVDKASQSMELHSDLTMGILYAVITLTLNSNSNSNNNNFGAEEASPSEIQQSEKYFQYLHFIVRDNFAFCVSQLKQMLQERYVNLLDPCRSQLLWLIGKFVSLNVPDLDTLVVLQIRQVAGGDISNKNMALVQGVLTLMENHKKWLYSNQLLIPVTVYTFIRLITDHSRQIFDTIRSREVALCVDLLQNRWTECMVIGRDLVRLLQEVAKIPEFESLWKDIYTKPTSLSPSFTGGLGQLLSIRTPRVYAQSRLTPEQETQLMWMMKNIKMGNQKRHQTWFVSKHLNTPESESLIPDMIRFICCCWHPPNQLLSSDIIPRWAVIGWLLKCVRTPYMAANAKLALFYDWLFFVLATDNIMNIEPAMLLMMHSLSKYAGLTATLLEFLVLTMELYEPTKQDMVRQGVHNSLKIMLSKGVVGTLAPLLSCPTLDPKISKKMIVNLAPFWKELEERGEIKNIL